MNVKSKKNTEKKYKVIQIDLKTSLSKSEVKFLDSLEKKFNNDFLFTYDNFNLFFHLNSIDLNKFANYVNENLNNDINSDLFDNIIVEIEKIKSYGIKSGKRIYVDYNKERKVQNRKNKVLKRGFHYYTKGNNFTKESNALPEEFSNSIICGDSEEILRNLPSNCVDLVFTSPPYNFGLDYDESEDETNWEEYFDKLFRIFKECIRVLKHGGRIIVNIQPLFSDYIPSHHIISNFFIQNKLIWKGEILWEKNNYNCKYTAWGSWKSPSSPYLKYTWEFVEIFCKGDLKKSGNKENIDITAEEFKDWVVAKWSIAPERKMKKYGHPAMFPEELVKRVLKLFSFKNDVVLDPFNGVGTTTAVSKMHGRKYLGIDISEEYCNKAEERLKTVTKTLDTF
jgi:DNA modification methylase